MYVINLKYIIPLTDFRNNVKKYLHELSVHKQPIVLTQNGKSAAVILDAASYQQMQDQMEFMRKVATGLQEQREDRSVGLEQVSNDIDLILS
ncbi:MAG TPA: type II toxin-antitoxin system Phd/YefM family antitoxin [bacterium]|nr:type II toxin-antitoxin system Phd/YefM family antitoxin [bacterium]